MLGFIALAGYIATIFVANWMLETFGIIPIGFGLEAPAGVLAAGVAFTARDVVQREMGKRWALTAILISAALSALVSPQFAVASGLAFLLSEFLDFCVYTPLWKWNWLVAVAASNAVGLVVDSVAFLLLAFGSLEFLAGQVAGKAYMTLAFVIPLALWRWMRAVPATDYLR